MKKFLFSLFICSIVLVNAKNEDGIKKAKGWKKYELTVKLTTGQTLELKSQFNIDFCNQVMFITGKDGNAIYPQNTVSVERKFKDGTTIVGYPTDSLWLFQAFKGNISGYCTRPETKLKHVEFLSLNNGDLVDFEMETLRSMLSDNQDALGLYYKSESQKKIAKNIFAGSFLVGLAHVYAPSPITRTVDAGTPNEYKKDIIFYPILALNGIQWAYIHKIFSKYYLEKSIRIYNK